MQPAIDPESYTLAELRELDNQYCRNRRPQDLANDQYFNQLQQLIARKEQEVAKQARQT